MIFNVAFFFSLIILDIVFPINWVNDQFFFLKIGLNIKRGSQTLSFTFLQLYMLCCWIGTSEWNSCTKTLEVLPLPSNGIEKSNLICKEKKSVCARQRDNVYCAILFVVTLLQSVKEFTSKKMYTEKNEKQNSWKLQNT